MKKLISLLLAAAMILCLVVSASAGEVTTTTSVGSYSASNPYHMTSAISSSIPRTPLSAMLLSPL